jgi:hypothetical protein
MLHNTLKSRPSLPTPLDQIIIFTRYPKAGQVKTRLIKELGQEGAAQLHQKLTEHTIKKITPVISKTTQLTVHYTGASVKQMALWLGDSFTLIEQQGADLGQRMMYALRTAQNNNFQRILLIGSDCPALEPSLIELAFKQLLNHDLVVGPSFDGGYYLIGISNSFPDKKISALFSNISWGTKSVYSQTLAKAKEAHLSFFTLQKQYDIDRPRDLEHFYYYSDS